MMILRAGLECTVWSPLFVREVVCADGEGCTVWDCISVDTRKWVDVCVISTDGAVALVEDNVLVDDDVMSDIIFVPLNSGVGCQHCEVTAGENNHQRT